MISQATMSTPNPAPKVALITGITGQDGSYLAEFLLEKGYTVHGIKRRASSLNTARVDHIYQDPHIENARFKLHYGDLSDSSNLMRIIQETQPNEIYNLGALRDWGHAKDYVARSSTAPCPSSTNAASPSSNETCITFKANKALTALASSKYRPKSLKKSWSTPWCTGITSSAPPYAC